MSDTERWSVFPAEGVPAEADALQHLIRYGCRLAETRTLPSDRAEWEARRPALMAAYRQALGLDPWLEKTPLNPRVTGAAERDYYRVENVVFESRPGFLVTANFFRPLAGKGPFPAAIVVPGHAMAEGKNMSKYLAMQLGLVRQGFAVLSYDPIGQGERKRPGFDHPLGFGSFLVGWTNEGYIAWDTIRAIDYLCSRPEVDASRIGLTGNSGGGENTFYTTPLDERIRAASACCFVCSYEAWLREGGNHCVCNHMPGLSRQMEQFEIIGLSAPRPFLACNASEDPIFPIRGTRATIAKAKAIYGLHGTADRLHSVETPGGHGLSQPLREATYGWFAQWLQGRGNGAPIPEPADLNVPETLDPILQCIKEDFPWPATARSMVELNRAEAARLIAGQGQASRAELAALFGEEPAPFAPQAQALPAFAWENCQVEPLALETEPGLRIAANLVTPANAATKRAVLLVTTGDRKQAASEGLGKAILAAGIPLLVLNPRGTGEKTFHENHFASNGVMVGRPLFAQMVWDIRQSLAWLRQRGFARVALHAQGPGGLLALAAACQAETSGVLVQNLPASFADGLADKNPYPLWFYLPNVLKVLDVPRLLALPKAPVLADAADAEAIAWLQRTLA